MLCSGISGILSGFFGIGGPLLALYFLAVTEEKEEYLGTLNGLFTITTLYQLALRIASGILTADCIPFIAVGIAAILLGRIAGSRIVDKTDKNKMRLLIYIFLAIAGILTIWQTM